jgi:hypothetical protein
MLQYRGVPFRPKTTGVTKKINIVTIFNSQKYKNKACSNTMFLTDAKLKFYVRNRFYSFF